MSEKPILFSGAMVRTLLRDEAPKTQTRRVLATQPTNGWAFENPPVLGRITSTHPKKGCFGAFIRRGLGTDFPEIDLISCPYGRPGDRLWVRESFWGCDLPGYGDQPCVVYDDEWIDKEYLPTEARPWARKFGRIPSIHMPRDCSRIDLEISDVRVERLQDISEADAIAEGIEPHYAGWMPYKTMFYEADGVTPANFFRDPRDSYRSLWELINGAGSWDANPWVWCVSFKRIASVESSALPAEAEKEFA